MFFAQSLSFKREGDRKLTRCLCGFILLRSGVSNCKTSSAARWGGSMSFRCLVRMMLLAACGCGLQFLQIDSCHGQVARYQPRTPTISPYLNLTRFDNGGIPNYYSLVRPQLQQQRFNSQAQRAVTLQEQQINSLQAEVKTGTPGPAVTGQNSWFMQPATQTRFLDSSRYFPTPARPALRR